MAAWSVDFLCEDDFDALLVISGSYDYGANASEEVKKIATCENDYNKCSLYVTVCIPKANQ